MSYNLYDLNRQGLPKLLDHVETKEQWQEKRRRIEEIWLETMGGLPEKVPVSYRIRSEKKEADHTRIHLTYKTVFEDEVTAYLLVPNDLDGAEKLPAVMALHPTNEQGKDSVATPQGKVNRMYGLELVSRGYVVLAPDALTSGERIYDGLQSFRSQPFYEKHPEWSTVGKNLIDHKQGLDMLCSMEYVDAGRIGVIGHSFGGYNSFFLAGLDDRIRAFVCSCGFSPFYQDRRPTHWGVRNWYTHLPKITEHLSQYQVPFDFHEIAALAAPIPAFYYYGQEDHIFPHWQSIAACMSELKQLYQLMNAEDQFHAVMTEGGHDFPTNIRKLSYEFLDHWLKSEKEVETWKLYS